MTEHYMIGHDIMEHDKTSYDKAFQHIVGYYMIGMTGH